MLPTTPFKNIVFIDNISWSLRFTIAGVIPNPPTMIAKNCWELGGMLAIITVVLAMLTTEYPLVSKSINEKQPFQTGKAIYK